LKNLKTGKQPAAVAPIKRWKSMMGNKLRGRGVRVFFVALAVLFVMAGSQARANGPTDSIINLFNEVSSILNNPALKSSSHRFQKVELVEKASARYFDYREMAKRSLGETWDSLNHGQQDEFVKDFSGLLKASHARSLFMFTKGKVTYQPQILKADDAEVPIVILPPNDKISVSFRMFKKPQGWMIYDLVIEGVSSLDHYKTQFARIIRESSFKNLLKVLKAKMQEKCIP
jgi:phospholipid transport system substrate-binding protein